MKAAPELGGFFYYLSFSNSKNLNFMAVVDTLGVGDLQNAIAGNTDLTTAQRIRLQYNAIPKGNTATRDALAGDSLFEGLLYYNTQTHKLNVRTAASWEAVTSA